MCLIWKAWANAFPDAKWVIVRRPDEQIVSSCLRTSFMRKRKTAEEWQEWVDYHKERFEEMKAYLNCKEVWTHKLVSGDLKEIRETLEWLGLEYNKSEILSFVDPTLYTAKS